MSLLIYALVYNIACFQNVTYIKCIVISNILIYMINSRKHYIILGPKAHRSALKKACLYS